MIDIRRALINALPKGLLIDLMDRTAADALKAHEVIRDNFVLSPKRNRGAVGQLRFRVQEQSFEAVVQEYGGLILDGGVMLHTDLKIFQPFARFEAPKVGVILGFASMPEPHAIPPKNQSRAAGVTANIHLEPRLDLDGTGPRESDIFVLFLVARDRNRVGLIEEVALGVIGAKYEGYIFYESLDTFLTEFDVPPQPPLPPDDGLEGGVTVKLRQRREPYVPPEEQMPEERVEDGTKD